MGGRVRFDDSDMEGTSICLGHVSPCHFLQRVSGDRSSFRVDSLTTLIRINRLLWNDRERKVIPPCDQHAERIPSRVTVISFAPG
ncbi:hypothetical protein RRSWK_06541 [Rhodopirellula sp. SWK7]|nr:hypothetical protein RRSWK_06541 [Rhodopirellula sp. SWK7]